MTEKKKRGRPAKTAARRTMDRIAVEDMRAKFDERKRGRPHKPAGKPADTEQDMERAIDKGLDHSAPINAKAEIRENTRPRAYILRDGAKPKPFVPSGRNSSLNLDRAGIDPDEIIFRPRKDRT